MEAARRLGLGSFILWEEGWPGASAFSPASRVGFSELLGGMEYSTDGWTAASASLSKTPDAIETFPSQPGQGLFAEEVPLL
jgi:hypothetical protein